jgi:predicted DNA-binding transcriptional regulator AlpA
MLKEINSEKYNATQASKYLGVCRKTFDTYVKNGELPKGIKEEGGVNYWLKIDLEKWK